MRFQFRPEGLSLQYDQPVKIRMFFLFFFRNGAITDLVIALVFKYIEIRSSKNKKKTPIGVQAIRIIFRKLYSICQLIIRSILL